MSLIDTDDMRLGSDYLTGYALERQRQRLLETQATADYFCLEDRSDLNTINAALDSGAVEGFSDSLLISEGVFGDYVRTRAERSGLYGLGVWLVDAVDWSVAISNYRSQCQAVYIGERLYWKE